MQEQRETQVPQMQSQQPVHPDNHDGQAFEEPMVMQVLDPPRQPDNANLIGNQED